MELIDLTTEIRPLFGMRYAGDPIIGLQLNVTEGNGYSEASIYAKLILSRDGELRVQRVYAPDLDPHMAQLVYNAIQNLDSVDLYPTLAPGGLSLPLHPAWALRRRGIDPRTLQPRF